jgi:hypothetical protein
MATPAGPVSVHLAVVTTKPGGRRIGISISVHLAVGAPWWPLGRGRCGTSAASCPPLSTVIEPCVRATVLIQRQAGSAVQRYGIAMNPG